MTEIATEKKRWRARAKTEQAGLDPRSADHCRAIEAFLAGELDRWRIGRGWAGAGAGRIVVYDAMPSEVDLAPLVTRAADPSGRFAVTRTPADGHTLTVHPYGGPLEDHPYGYRQPTADAPVVDDGDIGAVLVPALAFDRTGTRLGRGKGYYDRFLARLADDVAFVGVTGGYVVDALPADAYDVAMTHLATPDGVIEVPLPHD